MAQSSCQHSSEEDHCSIDEEGWWIEVEEKGFANQDKWHEDEGKIFRDCIGCFLDLCLFVSVFIM